MDFTEEPIESFENQNSLIKSIDEFKGIIKFIKILIGKID